MKLHKNYAAHAANMKHALRRATKRLLASDWRGSIMAVTVFDIGIVSTDPLRAGIIEQEEDAIELAVDDGKDVVLLIGLGQFGIPYESGYMPLTATKLVAELTRDLTNKDDAFDTLIPYMWALRNIAR